MAILADRSDYGEGLNLREMKISPTEYPVICAAYVAGRNTAELGREYGVTDCSISNVLRRCGVSARDPSLARRKFHVRDDAFSVLTPEALYWLGFLMADGCVIDESKVQLSLMAADRGHIELFRNFIGATNPIYNVASNRSTGIKFHSRQIVLDLAKHGIIPRKSIVGTATSIEAARSPAFWLGAVDGDGTIGLYPNRRQGGYRTVTKLCGPKGLMEQFAQFLFERVSGYLGSLRPSINRRGNLYHVAIMGERARNFLRLATQESPVQLARKAVMSRKIIER